MEGSDDPLSAIVKVLKPMESEERQRTIAAALLYLGDKPLPNNAGGTGGAGGNSAGAGIEAPTATAESWMKKHDVTRDQLDNVIYFKKDGSFEIHAVPGKSKKDKTLNAYTLFGLANYLAKDDRNFSDAEARATCDLLGCLDSANHAAYLKENKSHFSGDKSKGYTITTEGMKRAAAIIKEAAG